MRKGFLKQNSLPILSFCKSHFGLQLSSNSLNSSGAEPELNPAPHFSRTKVMIPMRTCGRAYLTCLFTLAIFAMPAAASRLTLPPETPAILDQIYSFDLDGAAEAAKHMEQERPNHPLGYLLEAEALWWRVWCAAPPEAPSGSALLGTGREGCFTGRSRDQATRIRGNAVLCRDGGRDDRAALRTARGEPQCRARRSARTRASPAGQGSGHGSRRCRSRPGALQLLRGRAQRHRQDSAVLHGHPRRIEAGWRSPAPARD